MIFFFFLIGRVALSNSDVIFLEFNVRSTVKVVVAFLDVVLFVENDCCLTFICWKDSDFFVFFQRMKSLSLLFLRGCLIRRFFTTVSTVFFGVTEKFKPFCGRSFSWGDIVLVERLTIHLDLSIVICF